jgi:hypothetical protein
VNFKIGMCDFAVYVVYLMFVHVFLHVGLSFVVWSSSLLLIFVIQLSVGVVDCLVAVVCWLSGVDC